MFPEADGGGKGVDEYVLIAMQRLALARPDPEAVRRWRFALDGKPPVSLTDMAQDCLAMLVEGGGGGGEEPNGLRSYLQGTLGMKQAFAVWPRAACNLLISIADNSEELRSWEEVDDRCSCRRVPVT